MTATGNGGDREELVAIGRRFQHSRKLAGHTQDYMARHLGVMPRTIQRWERGQTDPGILMTIRWAESCETTIEWLATGSTDVPALGLSAIERIADQLAEHSSRLRGAATTGK